MRPTESILFLDIDGVLNSHDFCPKAMCGPIHRDKVDHLNRILVATDAKVVLSSAWRYIAHRGEANLAGLDWLLRSHGLHAGRLIGFTREDTLMQRSPTWDGSTPWPVANERGEQILDWLRFHPAGRIAVLDDLDLGITAVGLPLVQTNGSVGLTGSDADRVIELLKVIA